MFEKLIWVWDLFIPGVVGCSLSGHLGAGRSFPQELPSR